MASRLRLVPDPPWRPPSVKLTLPGIYAEDLIHLLRKQRAFEGSRSPARIGNPKVARKLDRLHSVPILRLAGPGSI